MRPNQKAKWSKGGEWFVISGEGQGWDEHTMGIFTANEVEPGAVPTHHVVPDFPLETIPSDRLFVKSEELGLYSGTRLLDHPTAEAIARSNPSRNFLIVDLLRPNWDFTRPENQGRFKNFDRFLEHYYGVIADAMKKYPNIWACGRCACGSLPGLN